MEVVLRTIARQFDASTITVWLTDRGSACARFQLPVPQTTLGHCRRCSASRRADGLRKHKTIPSGSDPRRSALTTARHSLQPHVPFETTTSFGTSDSRRADVDRRWGRGLLRSVFGTTRPPFRGVELAQALANQGCWRATDAVSDQSGKHGEGRAESSRARCARPLRCIHGSDRAVEASDYASAPASTPKRVRTSPAGGDGARWVQEARRSVWRFVRRCRRKRSVHGSA